MAEATAMRNNALPYPVYGVAFTVVFPLLDADGDPISPSSPDSEVSKNGDTFADCTNEATEIATSSGVCYLTLTATEMTADIVTVRVQSTGAKTTILTLYPRKLVVLSTGTCQGSNDTGDIQLASGEPAVDDYYNGCLVVAVIDGTTEARIINDYVGSTKVGEIAPAWNTAQPDSNDTYTIYLPEGRQFVLSDARAFGGTAGTFASGRPEVNASHWGGTVVGSTEVRANLINVGGSAVSASSGLLNANVTQISGDATAADNLESYTDGTTPMPVNLTRVSGAAVERTLQAGGTTSITLASTEPTLDDALNGYLLYTTGGTGASQTLEVTDYVGATQVATVRVWQTEGTPAAMDGTTTYQNLGPAPDYYAGPDTSGTTTLLSRLTSTRAGYIDNLSGGAVALAATALSTAQWTNTRAGYLDNISSAAPTAAAVADAVWDEAMSGHLSAGSTGEALNAAGSAGDPWTTTLPGSYTGSQAGKILADILTDTGTTLQGELDGIQADTEDIQSRLPAALVSGRMDASVGAMAANTLTASALATDAVAEIQSGLSTHSAADVWAAATRTLTSIDEDVTTLDLDATIAAAAPTAVAIADAILGRNVAGGSSTGRTVSQALFALRNKVTISGGTMTVYSTDDTTSSWTATVTSDAAADPITAVDPG